MKTIWKVICRDAKKVTSNVISIIVCMGLVIIPSMYAWFNTEGSWDPYTNTKNLKVAVANTDEGYKSNLMPMDINLGEKVVSSLRSNTHIGYIITDKDDAIEGIKSGKYYASIIIPENFSKCLMTALSDDAKPAELTYYNNEKENAIASIVTDKASSAVKKEIDESFAHTISEVAASALGSFTDYMDSQQIKEFAVRLDSAMQTSSINIRQTSSTLRSYADLISSVEEVLQSSQDMLSQSSSATEQASKTINKTVEGVSSATNSLTNATTSVNKSVNTSVNSFDDVEANIDKAFNEAKTDTQKASEILKTQANKIDEQLTVYKKLQEILAKFNKESKILNKTINSLEKLKQSLLDTANKIDTTSTSINNEYEEVKNKLNDAKSNVTDLQEEYAKNLSTNVDKLTTQIDEVSSQAIGVATKIDKAVDVVQEATDKSQTDLSQIKTVLLTSADELDKTAGNLDELHTKLIEAASSNDVEKIKTILNANPQDLATFIAAPVGLERVAIYPVHNNGSAMAPFYTTLSLWVGATVLVAIVKVKPSEEALRETGAKPRHAYFGRLVFFIIMAFLQASLVGLGNLFYLQIQCVEPMHMMIACWFSSFIYMNIIYALTVAFGDVGKAIAVLLLVIQVAGSGGTFPPEMLPPFFQALYPFLPFVPTMSAIRSCIAGIYGSEYVMALAHLALFLIPSLVLGLLLRKPVDRLNEWIEESLESTKIM